MIHPLTKILYTRADANIHKKWRKNAESPAKSDFFTKPGTHSRLLIKLKRARKEQKHGWR